jgi:hypothetical protein
MVAPVDRDTQGAALAGFQPFQYDSGRATASAAAAGVNRTLAGVAEQTINWTNYVRREQQEATRQAESLKAARDAIDLENAMGPVVSAITQDGDLTPDEKRRAFDEAYADATTELKYTDPEVSLAAEKSRHSLRKQWAQGLDEAILKEERAKSQANLNAALAGLAQTSVSDPARAIARAEAIIISGARAAGWDAAKEEAEIRKWTGMMEGNAVRRQLADPNKVEGLYASLLDESQFPGLDPKTRTTLITQAATQVERVQRDRISAAERADRQAERAVKESQAGNAAQFRVGIMAGEVSESQLTAALQERRISLKDFNQLLPAMRGEVEQTDDPDTVVSLTKDLYDGTADERYVWQAYADGRLSKDTATRLMSTVESVRKGGGVLGRDDVKRGREDVDQLVGGTRGPLAILDTQSTQRVRSALRDYDEAIQAEDEAARAEGRQPDFRRIADEIVARWKPDDQATLSALPRPYGYSGPRAQLNVEEAKAAIADAFDRGELSPAQIAEQVELLKQYETILNRPKPEPTRR